jgi:hypothetical protein
MATRNEGAEMSQIVADALLLAVIVGFVICGAIYSVVHW